MNKTLYFEGAGWNGANAEYNGLNCRIRTAFHNNDGKMIYLELNGCHPNKYQAKEAKKNKITLLSTYMYVDAAHYITDNPEIDDCNGSRINTITYDEMLKTDYTLENIRNFINTQFNCSFDNVVILDSMAGYRVFTNSKRKGWGTSEMYNFGDCFEYDEDLIKRRIAKVAELSKYFKEIFGMKYDNTSYYIKDGQLIVCINVEEQKRINAGYSKREFTVSV
ncbi:MAG: hypothetical protein NC485_12230 [Ruminococcus flavefaciens]|nr:hypothetical protein [Ruminococcus flavefaciens]MCM1060086.1 hypothetical protein [Eubacterium sp.]